MKRGRRGRPSSKGVTLANASVAQLQSELQRRERSHAKLRSKRETLMQKIRALEQQIGMPISSSSAGTTSTGKRRGRPPGSKNRSTSVGRPGGRRGPRGQNTSNLVDSLHGVLRGKTLSVSEVSDAVQRAGYKTGSSNFRTIVNQALLANPSKFKKVARGQYTAKA